ncbi:protein of unknown function [Monaibacterium marinum]|uniref:DUF934 domain-containing protein n=1 Tax=Pontivivens marinum TaxID=1690039 RepID=A0A2C9CM28_9RHOB|nr:DUF934 domain-containing protein [Monaibacterium marinum]SOH92240.1 protein of unknown function [Monaibacterium marinum]
MSVIVTDAGFGPDGFNAGFAAPGEQLPGQGVDVPNDADVVAIFDTVKDAAVIRIPFPSSADGRGFSIASRLRDLGYKGTLRAQGHVIAEQYRKARGSGFDEVEIDDTLAARQPEPQWKPVQTQRYQSKFRRSA